MRQHSSALTGALFLAFVVAADLAGQAVPSDTTEVVPLQPVLVNVLRTPFLVTTAPFAVAANTQDEVQRGRPGIGAALLPLGQPNRRRARAPLAARPPPPPPGVIRA